LITVKYFRAHLATKKIKRLKDILFTNPDIAAILFVDSY